MLSFGKTGAVKDEIEALRIFCTFFFPVVQNSIQERSTNCVYVEVDAV
jgi:hypothetical protein